LCILNTGLLVEFNRCPTLSLASSFSVRLDLRSSRVHNCHLDYQKSALPTSIQVVAPTVVQVGIIIVATRVDVAVVVVVVASDNDNIIDWCIM